ncbi:MAG TPA: hypothetical protein DCG28_03565 [Lachnospiraceae bacterium]|nr:hypothetical protein [Lachnospiraceae bacterium]
MLVVATSDPNNYPAFDEIAAMTGHDVAIVISTNDDINRCIDHYYKDNSMNSVPDDTNKDFVFYQPAEEKMKLKRNECPYCGAKIQFPDEGDFFCEYCDSAISLPRKRNP